MSIESVVREAVSQLQEEKFDAAMISACISLDATAKNEFGTRPGKRCRQFIRANMDIITCVGFGGAILVTSGATLKLKDPSSPGAIVSFEDIIYESIRCSLLHEARLPPNVVLTKDGLYGERNGQFHIPVLMIYAMILAVVVSPTNSSRRLGIDVVMTIRGKQLHVDQLWGKPDVLRQQLGIPLIRKLTS